MEPTPSILTPRPPRILGVSVSYLLGNESIILADDCRTHKFQELMKQDLIDFDAKYKIGALQPRTRRRFIMDTHRRRRPTLEQ